MAEYGAPRTLTTGGGTISFNTREPQEYFIKSIDGEDGTPVRAPFDNKPHADGGIPHDFWDEPRHITVKGVMTLDGSQTMVQQITARNGMEDALIAACKAIRRVANAGTWSRDRTGVSAQSLTVQCDMQPIFTDENDGKNFTFGLVAANPDWT